MAQYLVGLPYSFPIRMKICQCMFLQLEHRYKSTLWTQAHVSLPCSTLCLHFAPTTRNKCSNQSMITKQKAIIPLLISYWTEPTALHETFSSIRYKTKFLPTRSQKSRTLNRYRLLVNKHRKIVLCPHELLPPSDSQPTYSHVLWHLHRRSNCRLRHRFEQFHMAAACRKIRTCK